MLNAVNEAKAVMLKWADQRISLDYWFCEVWLCLDGLRGREKSGRGTITHLLDSLFAFQCTEGSKLELQIKGDIVFERVDYSPDGFQLQVRTPDHGAWILLKPSPIAQGGAGCLKTHSKHANLSSPKQYN
jgi:hypothetical protein